MFYYNVGCFLMRDVNGFRGTDGAFVLETIPRRYLHLMDVSDRDVDANALPSPGHIASWYRELE